LSQISVTVSREAEEAVVVLVERLFGQAPCIYAPEESAISVVTTYSQEQGPGLRRKREALKAGLRSLAEYQLDVGPGKLLVQRLRREDWANSWKKYFKTIEIDSALLIRPSWSKQTGQPGQSVVTLDPGLSFGTGQHPTTAYCLRELVRTYRSDAQQSFWDVGTGSGILAISAVKLGYSPVQALDNDPVAVRIARTNARRNRVANQLTITRQDITKLPVRGRFQYDLICANLVHDLLINQVPRIVNRLRPSGKLVLAGILASQFAGVQAAYESVGLRLDRSKKEREWQSGTFAFR
jgi:ribosomal protein L11 methyltransferase